MVTRKSTKSSIRKDTHRKPTHLPELTALDCCEAIPNLLATHSRQDLLKKLGVDDKTLNKFIKLDKLPTEAQCKIIKELLYESYQ